MKTWAVFFYGVATGLVLAWVAGLVIDGLGSEWLLLGGAAALAVALLVHQRHVSLSKGRRWKKTI